MPRSPTRRRGYIAVVNVNPTSPNKRPLKQPILELLLSFIFSDSSRSESQRG